MDYKSWFAPNVFAKLKLIIWCFKMKIFMFNLFVSLASSNASNLYNHGVCQGWITLNITLILYGLMMTSNILVSSIISLKRKFQLVMVSLGICIFFINFGLCCPIKCFFNKTIKLKKWLIFSGYRFVALHNEYLIIKKFGGWKLIWNYSKILIHDTLT